ncbi:hypothetical protein [Sediminitomix flava]|nr:hypothetical protein [Sediminitomix flava]
MAEIQTVPQLFKELGNPRMRNLIDVVFRFKSVKYELVVDAVDGEENLVLGAKAKSIIQIDEDENVTLDERLISFLENFLEINEDIQNYEIDEGIRSIQKNIRLYTVEEDFLEKKNYRIKIERHLRKVGRVIRRNATMLRQQVELDYKTAATAEVKKIKIKDHDEKAQKLLTLIHSIEEILDHDPFFVEDQDDQMHNFIVDLRFEYLRMARTSLVELSQEIVSYINKINNHDRVFKKLMKIKRLKDLYELENRTNIEDIFAHDLSLFFETKAIFATKPSLELLRTDEGLDIIQEVANKRQHLARERSKANLEIDLDGLDTEQKLEQRINFGEMKKKFKTSGQGLYDFVKEFPFKVETSDEDRIKIFCKMALMYENEMNFTGDVVRDKIEGKETEIAEVLAI